MSENLDIEDKKYKLGLINHIQNLINDKNQKFEAIILKKVKKDGRDVLDRIRTYDANEYIEYRLSKMKKAEIGIRSNEIKFLKDIAREPKIHYEEEELSNISLEDAEYELTNLEEIQEGTMGIWAYAKVIDCRSHYSESSKQTMLFLTVQSGSRKFPLTLFRNDGKTSLIYNAFEKKALVGKTLFLMNVNYPTPTTKNGKTYPSALVLSNSPEHPSGIKFVADDFVQIENKSYIVSELSKDLDKQIITIKGKLMNIRSFQTKDNKEYLRFSLMDSIDHNNENIACTLFDNDLQQIKDAENKIVQLEGSFEFENSYSKQKSFTLFGVKNFQIIQENDSLYSDKKPFGKPMVYSLAELSESSVFEGYVYISNLRSQFWNNDITPGAWENGMPYVKKCNHPNHDPNLDWKRYIFTNDAGEMVCAGCNNVLSEEETILDLQMDLTVFDGENLLSATIMGDKVLDLLELDSKEIVISNFNNTTYDKFFQNENMRCDGRLFKIRGSLKHINSKNGGNAKFTIYNIESVVDPQDVLDYESAIIGI